LLLFGADFELRSFPEKEDDDDDDEGGGGVVFDVRSIA
jgi:hypothetical protein